MRKGDIVLPLYSISNTSDSEIKSSSNGTKLDSYSHYMNTSTPFWLDYKNERLKSRIEGDISRIRAESSVPCTRGAWSITDGNVRSVARIIKKYAYSEFVLVEQVFYFSASRREIVYVREENRMDIDIGTYQTHLQNSLEQEHVYKTHKYVWAMSIHQLQYAGKNITNIANLLIQSALPLGVTQIKQREEAREEILGLTEEVFGKKNYICLSEDRDWNSFGIYIKFDELTMTNADGREHDIEDLVVYLRLEYNEAHNHYRLKAFRGCRFALTYAEWRSKFAHSHLSTSSVFEFTDFCLGETPLSTLVLTLMRRVPFSAMRFQSFLYQMEYYLSWESLEGGPYVFISDVHEMEDESDNTSGVSIQVVRGKTIDVLLDRLPRIKDYSRSLYESEANIAKVLNSREASTRLRPKVEDLIKKILTSKEGLARNGTKIKVGHAGLPTYVGPKLRGMFGAGFNFTKEDIEGLEAYGSWTLGSFCMAIDSWYPIEEINDTDFITVFKDQYLRQKANLYASDSNWVEDWKEDFRPPDLIFDGKVLSPHDINQIEEGAQSKEELDSEIESLAFASLSEWKDALKHKQFILKNNVIAALSKYVINQYLKQQFNKKINEKCQNLKNNTLKKKVS